jgi:hypothetical protein
MKDRTMSGSGRSLLLQRVCCGSRRLPLEPHRPAPWLLRTVSWLLAAAGIGALTPVAVLFAVDAPERLIAGTASAGIVALILAALARCAAKVARPVPIELAPLDRDT